MSKAGTDPMQPEDDQIAAVDHARSMYNDHNFGRFSYGSKRHTYNPLLLDFLDQAKAQGDIYDIGCGAGFWLDIYQQYGFPKSRIHGLDLAPANAENLSAQGYDVRAGNAMDMKFENNVADYTVSSGVIHHTPDSLKAFREIVRITKPGGKIFINVYNIYNPYFWVVHKMTRPLRLCYWHISEKIVDVIFPPIYLVMAMLSRLILKSPLDRKSAMTLFMDQVMTPRAELFSKGKLSRYGKSAGVVAKMFRYNKAFLMISVVFEKPKDS
jgi:SAM-dependent methyltransferase